MVGNVAAASNFTRDPKPNAFDQMDNSVGGIEFAEKVLKSEGKKVTPPNYEVLQANKERIAASQNDLANLSAMEWLKITLKQLECQVPGEDTMKASEIAAQFTSMGMLTGMNKVADNVNEMKQSLESMRDMKASHSIGRTVEAQSSSFNIKNNVLPTFGFSLPQDVEKVTVSIYDEGGMPVKTIHLDEKLGAGKHLVEWHGDMSNGKPAKNGMYRFTVQAEDSEGMPLRNRKDGSIVKPTPFIIGQLEEVNQENKEIIVNGVSLPRSAWKATINDKGEAQPVTQTTSRMDNFAKNLIEELEEKNNGKQKITKTVFDELEDIL